MEPEPAFSRYQLSKETGSAEDTEYFLQRFLYLRHELRQSQRATNRIRSATKCALRAKSLSDTELRDEFNRTEVMLKYHKKANLSTGASLSFTHFQDTATVLQAELSARENTILLARLKNDIKTLQAKMKAELEKDAIVTYQLRSPRRASSITLALQAPSRIPKALSHESVSGPRHLT